jgi:uncharacterized protein (DUF885 family)
MRPLVFLALLITLGINSVHAQTKDPAAEAATQLKVLLDEDLDATFRRNPIQATVRGVPGYNHLLPDLSLATLECEHARERTALARLKALDAKALHGQDRISYELLIDKMELAVEAQQFPDADALVLTTLGGLHNVLPRAAQVTPFRKAGDYRDYIERILAASKLAEDTIARLRLGMANGWMSTRPVLDRMLFGALKVAYMDVLSRDRHPAGSRRLPGDGFAAGRAGQRARRLGGRSCRDGGIPGCRRGRGL